MASYGPVQALTMWPVPQASTSPLVRQGMLHDWFELLFFGPSVVGDKDRMITRANSSYDKWAEFRQYVYAQKIELGIPLEARGVYLLIEAPLGWKGYQVHLIGTYAGRAPYADAAPRFSLLGPSPEGDIVLVPLIVWRRWVYYRDVPAWLNAVWHPEGGEKMALLDIEYPQTQDQVKQVFRGKQLLQKLVLKGGGRTTGTTMIAEGEISPRYIEACERLKKRFRGGHRLRYAEIAFEMGISEKTLQRYRPSYGLPDPNS